MSNADQCQMKSNIDRPVKQKMAIILLARGVTISSVAKRVGVSESTIYGWKCDPEFVKDTVNETKYFIKEFRQASLALVLPAFEQLSKLLVDDDSKVRLKAVQQVLRTNGLDCFDTQSFAYMDVGLDVPYL